MIHEFTDWHGLVSKPYVDETDVFSGSLHRCPRSQTCTYCQTDTYDTAWAGLSRDVYCICLESRDDRLVRSAQQFHKVGLCRLVVYYRGRKPSAEGVHRLYGVAKVGWMGCYSSHQAVAKLALTHHADRAVVFEDDVVFRDECNRHKFLTDAQSHVQRLGSRWDVYYLGHNPLLCIPLGGSLHRTCSGTTHAYMMSRQHMQWLAANPFQHLRVRLPIDVLYMVQHRCYTPTTILAIQKEGGATDSDDRGHNWDTNLALYMLEHHPGVVEAVQTNLYVLLGVGLLLYMLCSLH